MAERTIYRITFMNQGSIYEIYAKSVGQGEMLGFVEVEQLLFGERSEVVVDPSEERLKTEFSGVKRFFIPMHAVIRIDQMEKPGASRITGKVEGKGNVMAFPPTLIDGGGSKKS